MNGNGGILALVMMFIVFTVVAIILTAPLWIVLWAVASSAIDLGLS